MRKDINRFPEYADLDVSKIKVHVDEVPQIDDDKVDELQKLIFAPDPRTGLPQSDLGIVLSKDSNPEIAQYIRDHLMTKNVSQSQSQNVDEVLASTKTFNESYETYRNRLVSFISKNNDIKV